MGRVGPQGVVGREGKGVTAGQVPLPSVIVADTTAQLGRKEAVAGRQGWAGAVPGVWGLWTLLPWSEGRAARFVSTQGSD